MKRFEYEVTIYPAAAFQQLVYFCTSDGECQEEPAATSNVSTRLTELLNDRGGEGWELVDMITSPRAIVGFWKRELPAK